VAMTGGVSPSQEDNRTGMVYLLVRPTNSALVKVGYTAKSAEIRAANYTDGGWTVENEYLMPSWLTRLTEAAAHKKLANYWLDPGITNGSASEVFTCSIETADTAIKLAYLEQLESSLRSLRIPDIFISIVIKHSSIHDIQNPIAIEKDIEEVLKQALMESRRANLQIEQINENHRLSLLEIQNQNTQLKQALVHKDKELKALQSSFDAKYASNAARIESQQIELSQFRQGLETLFESSRSEIKVIERYSKRKIVPRDFDSLKDHFSISVGVINKFKIFVEKILL